MTGVKAIVSDMWSAVNRVKQSVLLSAVIERVVLRGVTHKSEDTSEYVFEVGSV